MKVGENTKVFKPLGASNHSVNNREQNDYYATPAIAVEKLLERETFSKYIWEPACGEGHISKVLEAHGYDVASSDIIDRGYSNLIIDFLTSDESELDEDIITNPPYKYALEFAEKALSCVENGHKVAMLLKLQFFETVNRANFLKNNPPRVYIFANRISCAINGDFSKATDKNGKFKSAQCYAWFVWEKGYKGPCVVDWITEDLRYA